MPSYYYADENRQPVGPFSAARLRELHSQQTIANDTLIVEAGGTDWHKFAERPPVESPASPGAVQESAAEFFNGLAFMFRSATTVGQRLTLYGAIGGMLGFVLPWATVFGGSITGFGVAGRMTPFLFFMPISFIGILVIMYANLKSSPLQQLRRARWLIVLGSFWCAVAMIVVTAGASFVGSASIGAILTLLSSAAVAAGGILQVDETLSRLQLPTLMP